MSNIDICSKYFEATFIILGGPHEMLTPFFLTIIQPHIPSEKGQASEFVYHQSQYTIVACNGTVLDVP